MIRIGNIHLSALQSECIENDSLCTQYLRQKGLLLNPKVKDGQALNFLEKFEKFDVQ